MSHNKFDSNAYRRSEMKYLASDPNLKAVFLQNEAADFSRVDFSLQKLFSLLRRCFSGVLKK